MGIEASSCTLGMLNDVPGGDGDTPFQLINDQEVVGFIEYMVLSVRIVVENRLGDTKSLKELLFH